MEHILRQNNLGLLQDMQGLRRSLEDRASSLPAEWQGYATWARSECEVFLDGVARNLRDLDHARAGVLPDVLSQTQTLTRSFLHFSRQVNPVLRGSEADKTALRVLLWTHGSHRQTKDVPVAVSSEDFSVWPEVPPTYFLPCSVQQRLLYLPLFFHEFGHLLYRLHEPEMDELVKGLQETIADMIVPMSHHDDPMDAHLFQDSRRIVERWYEWTQEFFCDAVGLTIGGESFARAFSTYLRMRGRDEFLLPQKDLEICSHPVTWLRIHVIAGRLRSFGLSDLAASLEKDWSALANGMGVIEDYFGFYMDNFAEPLRETLADMLTEAQPLGFESPAIAAPEAGEYANPVPALVEAWHRFLKAPEEYQDWEREATNALLTGAH